MKDVRKSLYERLGPVTLHSNDVLKIYNIIDKSSGKTSLKTESLESEKGETLKDLIEKTEDDFVHELEMIGYYSNISINLSGSKTSLYSSNESSDEREDFEKILKILKEREVGLFHVSRWTSLVLVALILMVMFALIIGRETPMIMLVGLIPLILAFFWHFFEEYASKNHKVAYFNMEYKKEGFFSKNRDAFLVSLTIAIFSLALNELYSQYFKSNSDTEVTPRPAVSDDTPHEEK